MKAKISAVTYGGRDASKMIVARGKRSGRELRLGDELSFGDGDLVVEINENEAPAAAVRVELNQESGHAPRRSNNVR